MAKWTDPKPYGGDGLAFATAKAGRFKLWAVRSAAADWYWCVDNEDGETLLSSDENVPTLDEAKAAAKAAVINLLEDALKDAREL